MIRKIIKIDESKCNGCGLCAAACHEGAIGMVDGVAKLLREDYCDGLGDCLPACPTGAITFEEREAPAYDEAAVKAAQAAKSVQPDIDSIIREALAGGCPGSQSKSLRREPDSAATEPAVQRSQLSNSGSTGSLSISAFQLAGSDQAGTGKCTVFQRCQPAHCSGLYCLRLRKFPPGIHQKPCHPHWLSETGQRGLQ